MTPEQPTTGYFPDPFNRPIEWVPNWPKVVLGKPPTVTKPQTPVRPRPKEKEAKIAPKGLSGLIFAVFQSITEVGDFIESLYAALPEELRRRLGARGITNKARAVFDHFEEIDWGKAMWNLAVNQLEDAIIGALMGGRSRLGDALNELGLQTALNPGYVAGSGSAYATEDEIAFQRAVEEAARRARDRANQFTPGWYARAHVRTRRDDLENRLARVLARRNAPVVLRNW